MCKVEYRVNHKARERRKILLMRRNENGGNYESRKRNVFITIIMSQFSVVISHSKKETKEILSRTINSHQLVNRTTQREKKELFQCEN